MKKSFINMQQGKNSNWRYILSLLSIFFFMILSGIAYVIILLVIDPAALDTLDLTLGNPILDLALSHIEYLFWLMGLWFSMKVIHKRPFRTLITPYRKINWKRIVFGFLIFFGLMAISSIIDFLVFPDDYTLHDFNISNYIWLVLIALLLVPIQTTCEELVFRGFILQWLGKGFKNPILLSIIVGGIFGSLHFANPEMSDGALFVGFDYVFTGFMLTYIAVKSNSAELSIGAHTANNVFLALFFTSDNDVFGEIPSLFVVLDESPFYSALMSSIIIITFYVITLKTRFGKRMNNEDKQIQ
ncbi:CPBP family intramembrane glutamic endopeptidase [Terribacillus saccharophilus]|uniref:CPBP family intramembrane glutamic endopeptidase n=1 Tax=Terribacillus saccharophilus TaxID=361277 RepID=UPI0020165365|nr:type II CAAX endopeptidase family protein [Terribacillus saccharophilus]